MDPVTAGIQLIEALTRLATVIAEGQTPEQRKQIWDWVIQDIAWWRKTLHIGDS